VSFVNGHPAVDVPVERRAGLARVQDIHWLWPLACFGAARDIVSGGLQGVLATAMRMTIHTHAVNELLTDHQQPRAAIIKALPGTS
jgi:hypothetical protein